MSKVKAALVGLGWLACAAGASANPVVLDVARLDGGCDANFSSSQLGAHTLSNELGTGDAFPTDERIAASATASTDLACASSGAKGGVLVSITNLTGQSWTNLFYVAELETSIANADLRINGLLAFRIDDLGLNVTRRSESGDANGMFDVGETWTFLIDGYANSQGLGAEAMGWLGLPSANAGLINPASGNIVAMNCIPDDCCAPNADQCFLPEPPALPLVALALALGVVSGGGGPLRPRQGAGNGKALGARATPGARGASGDAPGVRHMWSIMT